MARLTRKQKVEMWVEEFRPLLFLDQWELSVTLEPSNPDQDGAAYHVAVTEILPHYFSACISLYPVFWSKTFDDTYRKRTILHELLHCITEQSKLLTASDELPTVEEVVKTNEQLTEWITNIVWRLIK